MQNLSDKLVKKAFDAAKASKLFKPIKNNTSKVSFSSVLEKTQNNQSVSEIIQALSSELDLLQGTKEVRAIKSTSIENLPFDSKNSDDGKNSKVIDKIAGILGEVNEGQIKLQRLMDLVTSGQKISPQELIAIQAGVFSLVQELEIASKGIQELTQSARQIMNTNLG